MGKTTPIEWCDGSVNPVMGCDGCELWVPGKVEHCYAGSLHKIRAGRPGYADQFEVPKLFPGRMAVAAAWNTTPDRTDKPWLHGPRKIFISDMGDALSRDVPLEYLRDEVIGAVTSENGRRHHWLWPTKQPQRMVKLAEMIGGWPENLWAMTSVTSTEQIGRVRHLLRVPAKVRGVSYEPALGPVKFEPHLPKWWCDHCYPGHGKDRVAHRKSCHCGCHVGVTWIIVGGESGPGARPFDLAWARSVVEQCRDAGVAVFVKQLGARPRETIEMKDREFVINGERKTYKAGVGTVRAPRVTAFGEHNGVPFTEYGLNDRKGGDWSEWPEDLRVRQFPA